MFWIKEHISSHLYLDFFKQRRIIRIFIQIEGFQYLSSLGSKQYEEHMVSWRPPKNLRKRHSSHWLAWIYNWKDGQKRGMSECRNAGTLLKNNRGTAPELDGSEQDSSVVAARDWRWLKAREYFPHLQEHFPWQAYGNHAIGLLEILRAKSFLITSWRLSCNFPHVQIRQHFGLIFLLFLDLLRIGH